MSFGKEKAVAKKEDSLAKKILILRFSAMGDIVLCASFVQALAKALPDADITLVTSTALAPLISLPKNVKVWAVPKPKGLKALWALARELSKERYDALLELQATFGSNALYPFVRAPLKVGYDYKRSRNLQYLVSNRKIVFKKEHLLEGFFSFAKELGLPNLKPALYEPVLNTQAQSWVDGVLGAEFKKFIVFVPCASKSERNWAKENFINLAHSLWEKYQLPILLCGSASCTEKEICSEIEGGIKTPVLNLCGKSNLTQLTELLRMAKLVIGPDTGSLHLSSALKTPTIGLYAVADPRQTGPWNHLSLVVNAYPKALEKLLNMDPATAPWGTRVHDVRAMSLISQEAVMEKVNQVLGS